MSSAIRWAATSSMSGRARRSPSATRCRALFDLRGYHEAIGRLFGTPLPFHNWGYPLFTLPAFWPLAQLPYFWALAVWTVGLFAIFAAIVLAEIEPAPPPAGAAAAGADARLPDQHHRRPERLPQRGAVPRRRAQHRSAADPVRRADRPAHVQAAPRHRAAVRAGGARGLARHRQRRRHGARPVRHLHRHVRTGRLARLLRRGRPLPDRVAAPVRGLLHHHDGVGAGQRAASSACHIRLPSASR